ncbi:hypothetical protein AMTRI_Chr10g6180 [Amborella trichopoda]
MKARRSSTFWWSILIIIMLLIQRSTQEEEDVKVALITFLTNLSGPNSTPPLNWSASSDPCAGGWQGITCYPGTLTIKSVLLEGMNLSGKLDAASLCKAQSLKVLSVQNNSISSAIPAEISNCTKMTHLYLNRNLFSGALPASLAEMNNMKKLYLSNNDLTGNLPDFSKISGLASFLAENNQLTGELPEFHFSNFGEFNVSNNNFTGAIPESADVLDASSFAGNPNLCGKPLPKACDSPSPKKKTNSKSSSEAEKLVMFSGYLILGIFIAFFIVFWILRGRKKTANGEIEDIEGKKGAITSESKSKTSSKTPANRSEYSISSLSNENVATLSSSLFVLEAQKLQTLRFEDLLRAPAELLGKGRHGSLYKVTMGDGSYLAVKRIKDSALSCEEFKRRMARIDKVKHPNVLNASAFYCSKQEKLVVYEFLQNGSLFDILHGRQQGRIFGWTPRLTVAASIAQGLAYMHDKLSEERVAHGNLKSSNILFNQNMDPCITEYGVNFIDTDNQETSGHSSGYIAPESGKGLSKFTLEADVYSFGVLLLEVLTGKLVQNNGFDLAKWVHSVVSEEWTAEVFDKALMDEGASEQRMVALLQVAVQCVSISPDCRPQMAQVSAMINNIKEDEDKSTTSEGDSLE